MRNIIDAGAKKKKEKKNRLKSKTIWKHLLTRFQFT